MEFMATPPFDGDLSELIVYPQDFLFPIPENISYEIATLNEPFSVGLHTAETIGITPGSTVFISGMGPIGLLAILAAESFGATTIIASDAEASRLDLAVKLGATHTINIREDDALAKVKEYTDGEGADFVIEASGNVRGEQTALMALARGGELAYIGVPITDETPLNVPFMTDHETTIHGIFRYANTYAKGLQILSKNTETVENLLTDFYPLSETKDALEQTRTNKAGSLKVVIYPNEQLRK